MVLARVFVALWFLTALTLSLTGWFRQFSSATLFGIGALASATAFTVLHWLSAAFRGFTRARGLKRLTLAQTLRLFGILALIKAYQHVLPAVFAIPTGVLDVAFASTSFFVATFLISDKGRPKPGFIAWHVAGVVALGISVVFAVLTATPRFGLVEEGITSQPMSWFPMSIVPTFIGPFVLVCHLLAITAARQPSTGSPPKT
jgi:hypothetical protein